MSLEDITKKIKNLSLRDQKKCAELVLFLQEFGWVQKEDHYFQYNKMPALRGIRNRYRYLVRNMPESLTPEELRLVAFNTPTILPGYALAPQNEY